MTDVPAHDRVGLIPATTWLTRVPLMAATPAHSQPVTHRYTERFPAHLPREDDPYFKLFQAYHRATQATAVCFIGERTGFGYCSGGLELHHAVLEFSTVNGVDLKAIQVDHPDLKDADAVARWAESDPNFRWLCEYCHRGNAGAHVASHSDWEASQYVPGFLS